MATPKRRSARLASAQRVTESPAPPQLSSIVERDEPGQMNKRQQHTNKLDAILSSPMPTPSTPATATSVKLPISEMHPSKVHPTMAPPSSGLRLGFIDIRPDDKAKDQPSGVTQSTPSKTPLHTSSFSFQFDRERDLGPEAREMMEHLRGETARIKAELASKREEERAEEAELQGRRIAQAKGKAGRYSAVHMAEFKKMDSIENHPSAFRANLERFTPLKAGIKRSQSRADLDEPDSARSSKIAFVCSTSKVATKQGDERESGIKRLRQRLEDDSSTTRPISRDGSAIPRPKSSGNDSVHRGIPRSQTYGNIMTPSKASLVRVHSVKSPTIALVKSPSRSGLTTETGTPDGSPARRSRLRVDVSGIMRSSSKKGFGGLTKSSTMSNLLDSPSAPTHVQTPGRFGKVKSILKRQFSGSKTKNDAHATPSPTKTPGPPTLEKELPPVPLTTPGRKLVKRVDFTPGTKPVAPVLDSPSPIKSGIPRSKTLTKLPTSYGKSSSTITNTQKNEGEVSYPDLSAYTKSLGENPEEPQPKPLPPSVPGAFTFRSDHTILFGDQPMKGFGAAEGQSSLRHVRESTLFGSRMPGSFPPVSDVAKSEVIKENKENADPRATPTRHRGSNTAGMDSLVKGIPHGMSNKKRSRATSDDEKDEGAKRGAKKLRKNPVPEGDALVAPRLVGSQSLAQKKQLSLTPSPRKKGGLSLSRLNMLARPKIRK